MLNGKKTYIVAGLTVLASFWLLITGNIDAGQFTGLLSTALIGAGIGHKIERKLVAPTPEVHGQGVSPEGGERD